jgi:hypothetical protein
MLTVAFGDNALARSWTFDWFSQLKCGETLLEVFEHSGHLPQVTQTKLWQVFAKCLTETNEVPFWSFLSD